MADQEEDFSQLPLPDRFAHKNWKVRKEGYEAAAKEFDKAQGENDPVVRQFTMDSGLWKGAVADSNVAAQQEGLGALCSFLQIAGPQGCIRTRGHTITPIVEKGLLGRPAAKAKATEALMLYIELDKPDPIIEELLPMLSHKQPKVIAATLSALEQIYRAYGCKTVEPKPTLKALPKVYGHADKNVRAAAQSLTVELYRWLKEAMKPLFWNDLKPVQQTDLEKLFEKVKDEPPPKQERLLRSQQAAVEAAVATGVGADEYVEDEEEAAIDLEPEYEAVDVMAKVPKDFQDRLASSKWKDRKEALDDLHAVINVPKIAEGPFDDIIRGLAKCQKDANIAVVTVAANCVELFAKGLKRSFAKYRATIMSPLMERLKEKKASVVEAIAAALDAVFLSTSLGECLEEILEFLKHKNPNVKLESTRFLVRCLKTTRDAPQQPEVKSIADAATKLLTESQEVQRSAGAEVLGTLWKIMGDRIMMPHLEGLDEIRKTKIKEFHESAEVKAKYKPKAAAPPKAAGPPAARKGAPGRRPAPTKKAPPPPRAPSPEEEPAPPPPRALQPKPTARPGASRLGAPKPSGLRGPAGLKKPGLAAPTTSPRRVVSPPVVEEPPAPVPQPKLGPGRGLAGRPLGKPVALAEPTPAPQPASNALSAVERAELEELRLNVERLQRDNEHLKRENGKMGIQIQELQNQNAQFIDDHTRDMLSIKAKETQLVRARSDFEESEQTVSTLKREVERLKRELSRQVRASSPPPLDVTGAVFGDGVGVANGRFGDSGYGTHGRGENGYGRPTSRYASGPTSPGGDKENFESSFGAAAGRAKLSPLRRDNSGTHISSLSRSSSNSGRGGRASPAFANLSATASNGGSGADSITQAGGAANGAESWKRAAEVTQNLKARIEMMKAKQGLGRPH